GRVVAEAGEGHGRPEPQRGPLAERAHEAPRERRLALLRRPWVEVLGDHEAGLEAGALGLGAPAEQVRGVELLEHRRIADLRHRREWYERRREGLRARPREGRRRRAAAAPEGPRRRRGTATARVARGTMRLDGPRAVPHAGAGRQLVPARERARGRPGRPAAGRVALRRGGAGTRLADPPR